MSEERPRFLTTFTGFQRTVRRPEAEHRRSEVTRSRIGTKRFVRTWTTRRAVPRLLSPLATFTHCYRLHARIHLRGHPAESMPADSIRK